MYVYNTVVVMYFEEKEIIEAAWKYPLRWDTAEIPRATRKHLKN